MKGHCWKVSGEWNGAQYVDPAESDGYPRPQAMLTRQLFAAWRDRGALDSAERDRLAAECEALRAFVARVAEQRPEKPDYWSSCGQCGHNISDAQDLIDAAMGGKESQGGNGSGQQKGAQP